MWFSICSRRLLFWICSTVLLVIALKAALEHDSVCVCTCGRVLIRNDWNILCKMFINLHIEYSSISFPLFYSVLFDCTTVNQISFEKYDNFKLKCSKRSHSLSFSLPLISNNQCFQWWIMFDRIAISMISFIYAIFSKCFSFQWWTKSLYFNANSRRILIKNYRPFEKSSLECISNG